MIELTFVATEGTLPVGLNLGDFYYVSADGFTATEHKISATAGGAAIDLTGTADGTYEVRRQGVNELDVIDLTANRLGRQLFYPTPGSPGSPGNPATVTGLGSGPGEITFTVDLATSTIRHEYTAGGTVTVNGGTTYPVTGAAYSNVTGATTVSAAGYTPQLGDQIEMSGLSWICNSASRPVAGQLFFPRLSYPSAGPTSFAYTRLDDRQLTYDAPPAPDGPDHEYADGGSVLIDGTEYGVAGSTYDKITGAVVIDTVDILPVAPTGTVVVEGLNFICPNDSAYVIEGSTPIDINGDPVANDSPDKVGFRINFFSQTNRSLLYSVQPGQIIDFRQRSQIGAPGHTFEYVGSGTNYESLPFNGGVPNPANKIIETNNGRVFNSSTDELGNFNVGDQFAVDGTTGSVTISTDQFQFVRPQLHWPIQPKWWHQHRRRPAS